MAIKATYNGNTFTVENGLKATDTDGNTATVELSETGVINAPTATLTKSVTTNGTESVDVTNYKTLALTTAVPTDGEGITPSGSLEITENGTYDVTEKASAVVNVPTSGGDSSGLVTLLEYDYELAEDFTSTSIVTEDVTVTGVAEKLAELFPDVVAGSRKTVWFNVMINIDYLEEDRTDIADYPKKSVYGITAMYFASTYTVGFSQHSSTSPTLGEITRDGVSTGQEIYALYALIRGTGTIRICKKCSTDVGTTIYPAGTYRITIKIDANNAVSNY